TDISLLFKGLGSNIRNPFSKKYAKFSNVYSNERPSSDEEYNDKRANRQSDIDKTLDKISRSGYDSLTKEEKELLFRESQKNRTN
ncbi:MAG: hypothetical protein K8R53_12370, partial [Bacteroidales bacterium]|nr:hypothetical protein [Bacteroidales bacterium]